jgi:membrane dipeptidase
LISKKPARKNMIDFLGIPGDIPVFLQLEDIDSLFSKIAIVLGISLVLASVAFLVIFPPIVDSKFNRVDGQPVAVSARALKLHRKLFIVDLHTDSLLWDRDLLVRNTRGHVDVPRLIAGNVAIQTFSIVTKVPGTWRGMPLSDQITLLALAERWPSSTWSSLTERVLYQAGKLRAFADKSDGKLVVLQSITDLDAFQKRRSADSSCVGAILSVEGAHALDGKLENVELFRSNGIRMMSPSHFYDNEISGSSYGRTRGGLTTKGKELIRTMQQRDIIVDLAHASSATIKDALAVCTKPVVVSHTGVRGTCDNSRNLSDAEIIGVAKTGGLIGIGYWPQAVCGRDAKSIGASIRHVANLVGVQHVALGSDFDGACSAPFDVNGLPAVTQALMDQGFNEEEIHKIMGGNTLKLLRQLLPER